MELLDLPPLLRMMHICHTLYDAGIPLVLRDIDSTHPRRRPLYCHYLLKDATRFSYITSLACYYNELRDGNVRSSTCFLDFLRLATRLQHLDVDFVEPLLELPTDFVQLVAHLPELKALKLKGLAPFSPIFEALTAPLLHVSIRHESHSIAANSSPITSNPEMIMFNAVSILSRYSESLQSLHVHFIQDYDNFVPGLTFPHVRTVYWESMFPVDTAAFSATFPNVRVLDIQVTMADIICIGGPPPPPSDRVQRIRQLNVDARARQWDEAYCIDKLTGNAAGLWALGLRCAVRYIQVCFGWSNADPERLRTLVAETRVSRLKVAMSVIGLRKNIRDLSADAFTGDTLEELEFDIPTMEAEFMDMVLDLQKSFQQAVWPSADDGCRLRRLSVRFWKYSGFCCDESQWREHCAKTGWDVLAQIIFRAIPSVQNISVDVMDLPARHWQRHEALEEGVTH